MGETHGWLFEPSFNRAVKVLASDERITSDAGLLLLREADHRLGLNEWLAGQLDDPRRQEWIRYQLVELLRERLYALALGYSTQDDADRLAHDPAMKLAVWDRPGEQTLHERLASQPTQSRLVAMLTSTARNRAALRNSLGESCQRHLRATGGDHAARKVTIDIDSFPIAVHGQQPGAAYNGHYHETVYHPLVASYSVAGSYDSMQEGRRLGNGFLHAILRQGQVHTAQGVKRFMQEVVRQARGLGFVLDFRIDAGYTDGETLDFLTDEKLRFLGRLKSNPVLDRLAEPHLSRPVGRPPKGGYEDVIELGLHRAESWKHPQRLLLVIVDRPDPKTGQLNLLPDYFFLVVGWKKEELDGPAALAHYRQRGTFEDRIGEFQQAIGPHLSHDDFAANEALLRLSLLAFNLASALRIEYEASAGSCLDLGRFQRDVLKAGGRVVKGSRRLLLYVARVVAPFWEKLIGCLQRWTLPRRFPTPRGSRVRAWLPPPRHAFLHEVRRC
ncbi:MAG: IS1380 family transposase [Gemmatimonadaceae bacterium]